MRADNINNLRNNTPRTTNSRNTSSSKPRTHVVGVKISTKSDKTKDKIYYYKTEENLKRGDVIRVKVPSGGSPKSTVSIENSTKKTNLKLKHLERGE